MQEIELTPYLLNFGSYIHPIISTEASTTFVNSPDVVIPVFIRLCQTKLPARVCSCGNYTFIEVSTGETYE